MNLKYKLFFVLILTEGLAFGQISLVNASFEDTPSDATVPKGWLSVTPGTTPDILPGFWGEYNEASHGDTYMGMITRENSTFESIGQRFSKALTKGQCYRFTIDIAHGKVYAGYNKSIKLRIWVGKKLRERGQMIFTSDYIRNEVWETLEIEFTPDQNYRYIILEAFYSDEPHRHKGNIFLDNMSSILECGRV
jgi:hypothetical protein